MRPYLCTNPSCLVFQSGFPLCVRRICHPKAFYKLFLYVQHISLLWLCVSAAAMSCDQLADMAVDTATIHALAFGYVYPHKNVCIWHKSCYVFWSKSVLALFNLDDSIWSRYDVVKCCINDIAKLHYMLAWIKLVLISNTRDHVMDMHFVDHLL